MSASGKPSTAGLPRIAIALAIAVLGAGGVFALWKANLPAKPWVPPPLGADAQRRADSSAHNIRAGRALQAMKFEEAEREARQAVELDPESSLAHLSLGMALETRRPEEALREVERAFTLHAGGDVWNTIDLLRAHSSRGRLNEHRGELERALADYEAALQADPGVSVLLGAMALVELHLGRFDDALAHANRCVSLDFNQAYPLAARGLIYLGSGHFAEAAADYEAALFLSPRTPIFYSQIGLARLRLGDLDQAEKAFVAAHDLDAKSADAMMGMGCIRAAQGNTKEARDFFDAAVQCAPPDSPDIWAERAAFREKQGDTKGALEDYRKALAVAPHWWPAAEKVRARVASAEQQPR